MHGFLPSKHLRDTCEPRPKACRIRAMCACCWETIRRSGLDLELTTLKDLRLAAQQTQVQMAAALGVRQDTISRLEKRSDMLLSTMRQYVESMGGQLELVAKFPDRPPVVINHIGVK